MENLRKEKGRGVVQKSHVGHQSLPLPPLSYSLSLPFPSRSLSFPLEVGPLIAARGPGRAL